MELASVTNSYSEIDRVTNFGNHPRLLTINCVGAVNDYENNVEAGNLVNGVFFYHD